MKISTILIVSVVVISLILLALCVYIGIMLMYAKKIKRSFGKCPKSFVNRLFLWYISFILWTLIEYFLLLIPLFTSVATIYFATEISSEDSSKILLTIMSIITALLPLISSKVLPKVRADGFYKGAVILENGMIKYDYDLISIQELINILEIAEKFTNPLARLEDLELALIRKNNSVISQDNK